MLLTPDRRLGGSRNDLDSPFAMDILGEKGEWRGLSASPAARYRASSPIFSPLESPAPPRSPPPPSPPMPTLKQVASRRTEPVPPPVPDDAEQKRRRLTMNAIARAARRRDGARVVGNAMRRLSGKQRDAAFRRWHVLELVLDERVAMLAKQLKELGVLDQRHLRNLRSAVRKLAGVERREEGAVEQRERGRDVRADLVLLARKVDARLRAN